MKENCDHVRLGYSLHACRSFKHPVTSKMKGVPELVEPLRRSHVELLLLVPHGVADGHCDDHVVGGNAWQVFDARWLGSEQCVTLGMRIATNGVKINI